MAVGTIFQPGQSKTTFYSLSRAPFPCITEVLISFNAGKLLFSQEPTAGNVILCKSNILKKLYEIILGLSNFMNARLQVDLSM